MKNLEEYEKTVTPLMDEATAVFVKKKNKAETQEELEKLQKEYEEALNAIAEKYWKPG